MTDRLTIYFTSDTHGYLYPTDFVSPAPCAQGLFSMRFPKNGNTLVIDGGDTLQGSPLTYYCHQQGIPMPCAREMNALGYDFVTLGNHDFNYGYETLSGYLKDLSATCLCGNVHDQSGETHLHPYAVKTLANGMRIGLVGMVTRFVNLWEKPENLGPLTVSDEWEAARCGVEALRGKVDFLIGLYHGGFEKDLDTERLLSSTQENIACRLCEELPFDLLLTGHQHIAMANRTYHGTHVVQTPCNATAYVKVTVREDGAIFSELCKPEIPQALPDWAQILWKDLNRWLDTPIGSVSRPLMPEPKLAMALHGSPIATLINQVQLAVSGADLSCTPLGNEVRGFQPEVTVRDVVASYPYTNTLVVLEVTGQMVRLALEQCATYFQVSEDGTVCVAEPFLKPKAAHYNYDYFMGICYTFDLRKPLGARVTRLTWQGKPMADDTKLTLVTNNYRATGAGDFPYYADCPRVSEMQSDVSEVLLTYLSTHGTVEVPVEAPYRVIAPNGQFA